MKLIFLALALALFAAAARAEPATIGERVAFAAAEQASRKGTYDPSYARIGYPMGDVPAHRGVCSDVVIRALRAAGLDLQELVHQDMKANFAAYPQHWGLKRPDANIDHRRVPNLEVWFTRRGWRLPASRRVADYREGDIVSWNLKGDAGYLPHIGVVAGRTGRSGRPLIAHNIGAGPKVEDVLFDWPITGRFRPQTE